MINDHSTDDWKNALARLPPQYFANVSVVSDRSTCRHDVSRDGMQYTLLCKQEENYNKHFRHNINMYGWVLVADLDEFVYARNSYKTIPEYLPE